LDGHAGGLKGRSGPIACKVGGKRAGEWNTGGDAIVYPAPIHTVGGARAASWGFVEASKFFPVLVVASTSSTAC